MNQLPTKGQRTRAAKLAMDLAQRVEGHIAATAEATLTERPGLNREAIEQLYADFLTLRPKPNRASRRECKRSGHVLTPTEDGGQVCIRCERRP